MQAGFELDIQSHILSIISLVTATLYKMSTQQFMFFDFFFVRSLRGVQLTKQVFCFRILDSIGRS
ncbi:hypothetical protein BK637_04395 [Pseudomonas chlororaphis]|nr:hypothetical protein BK637_04395 [Pseudomonas chlororaphis]